MLRNILVIFCLLLILNSFVQIVNYFISFFHFWIVQIFLPTLNKEIFYYLYSGKIAEVSMLSKLTLRGGTIVFPQIKSILPDISSGLAGIKTI